MSELIPRKPRLRASRYQGRQKSFPRGLSIPKGAVRRTHEGWIHQPRYPRSIPMPKFIVFMPGGPETETGATPPPEIIAAMTAYNEQLTKAGVLLSAEGLKPTSA